jgi:hypothetical protein
MAAMVQIIDESRSSRRCCCPFLAGLESKQPKVGRIRFRRACALWVGGNESTPLRASSSGALRPDRDQTCRPAEVAARQETKFRNKVERALAEFCS